MWTLSDQLFELRTNILRDRSDIIAGDTDSLWSDETLIRYIADAERKFCRQTMILRDGTTPEVTQVVLQDGVKLYPLHKSVMGLVSAKYDTRESDLAISGHSIVVSGPPREYFNFNPNAPYTLPPGDPIAVYSDETLVYDRQGIMSMQVYPAPGPNQAGKIIYLRVIRIPLYDFDINCQDRCSEIPEGYQLDMLEWAAYRALRTFDADAGAPTTAADHETAYNNAVTQVLREMKRRMFANIGFKYGQNGFRWTR